MDVFFLDVSTIEWLTLVTVVTQRLRRRASERALGAVGGLAGCTLVRRRLSCESTGRRPDAVLGGDGRGVP